MATNRDLLDAAAYTRRRLVAALVTGRADPDLVRPARGLVVGIVLAALVVAAVVVLHLFRSTG